MSDDEGQQRVAAPTMGVETMDESTALQEVLKASLVASGLVCGFRQTIKHVDERRALVCFLANSCDEPGYRKLVEALCALHSIPLVMVDNNKKLGEWCGLCKIDREGKPRKVVGCSCAAIHDWGRETAAHSVFNSMVERKSRS